MAKRLTAAATLLLSMGIGAMAVGPPALFAQQTDENGQVTNPQPHTKKEYKQEKKQEKRELKHNRKSDKAARNADQHEDKAAYERERQANEAAKANRAAEHQQQQSQPPQ